MHVLTNANVPQGAVRGTVTLSWQHDTFFKVKLGLKTVLAIAAALFLLGGGVFSAHSNARKLGY